MSIPPDSLNLRDHGKVCEFARDGKYTLDVIAGSQHEHTDKNWKGGFKNWQGSRMYNYTLDIAEMDR